MRTLMISTLTLCLVTACSSPVSDEDPIEYVVHEDQILEERPADEPPPAPVDEPVEPPVDEPTDTQISITLGHPQGWVSVRVVEFDIGGETVSEWVDRVGYPDSIPTVFVVNHASGDIWGHYSWRDIWADIQGTNRDRLFTVGSLADNIEGIEHVSVTAVMQASAEIALPDPVYRDLSAEFDSGESQPIYGDYLPGHVVHITVPAGDELTDIVDSLHGSLDRGATP